MSDFNQRGPGAQDQQGTGSTPPPKQQQPTQYWSSQDARRASGSPGGGYQRPYEPYARPQQPNPGWQQPRDPWDNRYYDNLNHQAPQNARKKTGKSGKGLIILAACLLGVVCIAIAGIWAYTYLGTSGFEDQGFIATDDSSDRRDDREEDAPAASGDGVQMELTSKPQVSEAPPAADGRMTIPQVAQLLLPSVVSVENYMDGYFFEAAGLGSGIIMNTEGYIVTNQHVIAGHDALKVTLNNGDPYEAVLIGQDARTDLAVIKINAPDLTPAEFGNSEELEVGETVIAIGNPATMELAGSVTQGIVSAVNRQVNTGTYSMTYIQTDAAINPGNSGGALVNEFGQVIGINSAKIVQEGFEGIGFAIPISVAKPIIDDLISNGRVTGRVMLGITAYPVDEVDARNYDIPMGLMIREIDPNSDMLSKGVQVRDIITHIDGVRVMTFEDLREVLDTHQVGDRVQLTLYRQNSVTGGTTYNVTITLMEDMG